MNCRKYIKNTALTGAGLTLGNSLMGCTDKTSKEPEGTLTSKDKPKTTLPLT